MGDIEQIWDLRPNKQTSTRQPYKNEGMRGSLAQEKALAAKSQPTPQVMKKVASAETQNGFNPQTLSLLQFMFLTVTRCTNKRY